MKFRGQNIPFLSTGKDPEAAQPLSRIQVPGFSVNIVLLRVSFEENNKIISNRTGHYYTTAKMLSKTTIFCFFISF
jgi:hypothetical protein